MEIVLCVDSRRGEGGPPFWELMPYFRDRGPPI